jgi:hypothetical protein
MQADTRSIPARCLYLQRELLLAAGVGIRNTLPWTFSSSACANNSTSNSTSAQHGHSFCAAWNLTSVVCLHFTCSRYFIAKTRCIPGYDESFVIVIPFSPYQIVIVRPAKGGLEVNQVLTRSGAKIVGSALIAILCERYNHDIT